MKMPKFLTRKTLRASTARRQPMLVAPDEMDYEEMSEPNMRLSRALLIVLVLHVVAVAGIVAFNSIKARQDFPPLNPAHPSASVAPAAAASEKATAPATIAVTDALATRSEDAHAPKPVAKPYPSVEHKAAAPADSGKTYIVGKGDNPVIIARKLKVPFDDLLALNHIDDPHKLQVGQKLLVPAKATKTKHAAE